MGFKLPRALPLVLTGIVLLFASTIDVYGQSVRYVYDDLNRLVRIGYQDGRVLQTYGEVGNRTMTAQAVNDPPTLDAIADIVIPENCCLKTPSASMAVM